jgi:RNA polymerase sigma-70 factor (ECF subfamily)
LLQIDLPAERQLVRRAKAGDEEAFTALYRHYAPLIFRYFFFRLHDRSAAEDLTGDVFVCLVRSFYQYKDQGSRFAAWLFRIAHARLVDHHRYQARRTVEALTEQTEDPGPGPEWQAAHATDIQRIAAALGNLSSEHQLLLQLRFVEGYNLEDTARIMGKTIGAVKAMQHRALRNLTQRLQA